jgi:four helix bundle protein
MREIAPQMRRSVISIPSNLAESYSRKSRLEYIQFVRIAFSLGAELETQLLLSEELDSASPNEIDKVYN